LIKSIEKLSIPLSHMKNKKYVILMYL